MAKFPQKLLSGCLKFEKNTTGDYFLAAPCTDRLWTAARNGS